MCVCVNKVHKDFYKTLLNLLQYCFCFLFWLSGCEDLSSLTRDQTHIPCIGRQSPNHQTAREVQLLDSIIILFHAVIVNEYHYIKSIALNRSV